MTKASDNEFPSVLFDEQAGDPSTPASGFWRAYFKAAGMYVIDDGGIVTGPFSTGGGATSLPTFVAAGSSATGTGDITPGLPAGHTTNDINILFVQTSNQAVTAPAGWTKLGPSAGFGTSAAAGSTRISAFWKRDSGADTDPTVTDPGDHALAQIIGIRGCVTTGDPFLCIGANRKTTASTTGTASAGATPIDNCLVINAWATSLDSASAAFSSFTNADLGSVTERVDVGTTDGTGGGIGVSTGTKAVAGTFAATTVTETSTTDVSLTFIMLPAGITSRAGFIDRQIFTSASTESWVKPTGARTVFAQVIGGGASGSAGRNAATAAGGGGGGGGVYAEAMVPAGTLAATVSVTAGAAGAATANTDGAASNAGSQSSMSNVVIANGGQAATASATGSGGAGGAGGGLGSNLAAGTSTHTSQPAGGGTGGTTAGAGGLSLGMGNAAGAAGAGGGTTQAASAGGSSMRAGAGGGGGRSNTNVGTGGAGVMLAGAAGGATAGAAGADSTDPTYGGGGGAGGTSAAGPGGAGGWPGGGGGGGGSQSGAQRGGAGGDGVVVVTTFC